MSWLPVLGRLLSRAFLGIVALFMLVVILAVAYWTWTSVEDWRLERKVSIAREWPSVGIQVLVSKDRMERARALKASVKTRCSEGVLYYILTIEKSDTVKTNEEFEELAKQVSQFHVQLLDADAFQISSITVPLSETRRLVGKSERVEAREANASTSCEKRAYARVARVAVGWEEQ